MRVLLALLLLAGLVAPTVAWAEHEAFQEHLEGDTGVVRQGRVSVRTSSCGVGRYPASDSSHWKAGCMAGTATDPSQGWPYGSAHKATPPPLLLRVC
jgi:hypothetical protein